MAASRIKVVAMNAGYRPSLLPHAEDDPSLRQHAVWSLWNDYNPHIMLLQNFEKSESFTFGSFIFSEDENWSSCICYDKDRLAMLRELQTEDTDLNTNQFCGAQFRSKDDKTSKLAVISLNGAWLPQNIHVLVNTVLKLRGQCSECSVIIGGECVPGIKGSDVRKALSVLNLPGIRVFIPESPGSAEESDFYLILVDKQCNTDSAELVPNPSVRTFEWVNLNRVVTKPVHVLDHTPRFAEILFSTGNHTPIPALVQEPVHKPQWIGEVEDNIAETRKDITELRETLGNIGEILAKLE